VLGTGGEVVRVAAVRIPVRIAVRIEATARRPALVVRAGG